MTTDQRDVALGLIKAYFNSRTHGLAPISCRRAIDAIRPILGPRPSDEVLLEMITEFAAAYHIAVDFDLS